MSNKNQGDITVIGNVSGIHLLEDIKVGVPCNVAVNIPVEKVLKSRDLQIALQRKFVRRAPREAGAPVVKKAQKFAVVPSAQIEKSVALEEENRRLRLQLVEAKRRLQKRREQEESLQQKKERELERDRSDGVQKQLDEITATLRRLESRPASNTVVMAPEAFQQAAAPQAPSRVADDTPAFIQSMDVQPDDVSIELESRSGGDKDILGAAKKLKSLREKRGK
jgi:hypothetical protein